MRSLFALLAVLGLCLAPAALLASDHADPALPAELDPSLVREPNITGLFVFPKGDQLVLVYNVFRSLSSPPPYHFEDYEFVVYMDLHSKINYDDTMIRARYGGHVVHPEGIKPDATITIHISNQAELAGKEVEGLKNPEAHPLVRGGARRPVHLHALLRGQRGVHGDEHPALGIPRRPAGLDPVGHHPQEGRNRDPRSRRPRAAHPVPRFG